MKTNMIKGLVAGAVGLAAATTAAQANELFIYNWSDYIAEDTIANFEKETGIKVTYDVFDSNEVLEAKLLAGTTGYDIVVPSGAFLEVQVQAGVFQEIDRGKIATYGGLNPDIMKALEAHDPGNKYAVPYLWGTTGLGYNVAEVKARIGDDAPIGSWDLLFKPEYASKMAECGISILDAPTEVMEIAFNYVGADPHNPTKAQIKEAEDMLTAIRPYVKYFHSSQYIDDIANGEICMTLGWSGDIAQAIVTAEEQEREIAYYIPSEGTVQWFDLMAIPTDARNVDNAHKFMEYVLRDQVMADITNYVWFPNAVTGATALVDPEITGDPSIYPPEEVVKKLWADKALSSRLRRTVNRTFTKLKTGT